MGVYVWVDEWEVARLKIYKGETQIPL